MAREIDTLLFAAVKTGDVDEAKRLFPDVNAVDEETGLTPLQVAAKEGSETMCKFLLERGALPDVKGPEGQTALHLSAKAGNGAACKVLLDGGANPNAEDDNGDTPLHRASHEGHEIVVILLLSYKAAIDPRGLESCTPLHLAARANHAAICSHLLDRRANIDAQGSGGGTPLMSAIATAADAAARFLIDRGANLAVKTNLGQTALHRAAASGNCAIATYLIKAGADVRTKTDDYVTPLHLAAKSGGGEMCKLLLEAGAELEAADHRAKTSLQYAASAGRADSVRFLLSRGANPKWGNFEGLNALHLARGEATEALLKSVDFDLEKPTSSGHTALHLAILRNDPVSCLSLLEYGARVGADETENPPDFPHETVDAGLAAVMKEKLADKLWFPPHYIWLSTSVLRWALNSSAVAARHKRWLEENPDKVAEHKQRAVRDQLLEPLRDDAWEKRKHLVCCYFETRQKRKAEAAKRQKSAEEDE